MKIREITPDSSLTGQRSERQMHSSIARISATVAAFAIGAVACGSEENIDEPEAERAITLCSPRILDMRAGGFQDGDNVLLYVDTEVDPSCLHSQTGKEIVVGAQELGRGRGNFTEEGISDPIPDSETGEDGVTRMNDPAVNHVEHNGTQFFLIPKQGGVGLRTCIQVREFERVSTGRALALDDHDQALVIPEATETDCMDCMYPGYDDPAGEASGIRSCVYASDRSAPVDTQMQDE